MKNLVIAIGAFMLLLNANVAADENGGRPGNENTYCAEVKDNALVVMRDGKPLSEDIVFDNGTELKTDGKVIYPDGVKAALKSGECIDQSGVITVGAKTDIKK